MKSSWLPVFLLTPLCFAQDSSTIRIWHGETRHAGRIGDAQDDFNITGHVERWQELDLLSYRVNGGLTVPLAYRAFRRLARDGDFNADVPLGLLRPGRNTVDIEARFRNGATARKQVVVIRESGAAPLPRVIRWRQTGHVDDAGQPVDGEWLLTPQGLRTAQPGYDRIFLIGDRRWRDYEVLTTVTIHTVESDTPPESGGNGVGLLLRFAGHVTGGPRHFPSGQPKWGYQPFGAIGWLRWKKAGRSSAPMIQFYRGDSDQTAEFGSLPAEPGSSFGLRFACRTLADEPGGMGVTEYRFRIWKLPGSEPQQWTWVQVQSSPHALRLGGFALLAHHVDATFGDVEVRTLTPQGGR